MRKNIEILLATYNGSEHLEELLNSLINQSYNEINILIHDDNSKDDTAKIIKQYQAKYPEKIKTIWNKSKPLGVVNSFSLLLEKSESKYVMLCDQDDVWLKEKIASTYEEMISLEKSHGNLTPILVHTDLLVVDKQLNIIDNSFYSYSGINNKPQSLNRILVQNFVTGCTVMLNRSLIDICWPIPSKAIMHDWWIALIALSMGKIGFLDRSTILYRQHDSNAIGAKKWSVSFILSRIRIFLFTDIVPYLINEYYQQAKSLQSYTANRVNPTVQEIIYHFTNIPNYGFFKKRYVMIKYKFYKGKFLKNIGLFLRI